MISGIKFYKKCVYGREVYQLWDTSFVILLLSNVFSLLCGTGKQHEYGRCTGSIYAELEWRQKNMKGYTTSTGYMGWVVDSYILFASEYDYREYMEV